MAEPLRDLESGLHDADFFSADVGRRVASARRLLRPFSIALIETVDWTPGMAQAMGAAITETLRESDTACRVGEGMFALLLDDTPDDGAVRTVTRLRHTFAEAGLALPLMWAGVASYPTHGLEALELVEAAEEALARARRRPAGGIETADPA